MSKYVPGIPTKDNLADWQAKASAGSFHNSEPNKSGGKPNEQVKNNSWFVPRDRSGDNGVAKGSVGGYSQAAQDRTYVGDDGGAGNHRYLALKDYGGTG